MRTTRPQSSASPGSLSASPGAGNWSASPLKRLTYNKSELPTRDHGASTETRSRRRVTMVSSVTDDKVVKSGLGRATRAGWGAIL